MEIIYFVTAEGSKVEICWKKLSVIFGGDNFIVNGEPVGVIDNTGGSNAYAVIEAQLVEMNG